MYRTEALVIKLNKAEKAVIAELAQLERLPSSTFARRLLLLEAEQRGITPPEEERESDARRVWRGA